MTQYPTHFGECLRRLAGSIATTVAMIVAIPVTVVLSVSFLTSTDVCGWANTGQVIIATAAAIRTYWIFIAVLLRMAAGQRRLT